MKGSGPAVVICSYRVRQGKEDEFARLLERHWPTLHRLGLATDEPARVYRGEDAPGKSWFVELFTWKDGKEGPNIAHQTPEVMSIWEPMGALLEDRLGRPKMEFPHFEPVRMGYA